MQLWELFVIAVGLSITMGLMNFVNLAHGAFAMVGGYAAAVLLDEHFPGDPSLLAALLLNRRSLHPGEALHLKAGTMHAYLCGTGVEVMASSDNVLRGGLTAKHVSVDELVRVVDFGWGDPEVMDGVETSPGVWDYPTHCHEFDVWRLEVAPGASVAVPAPEKAPAIVPISNPSGLPTASATAAMDSTAATDTSTRRQPVRSALMKAGPAAIPTM